MSFFNLFSLLRFGVLDLTISTLRDTRILERADINASIVQIQFFPRISLFATLQARRAARGLLAARTPPP